MSLIPMGDIPALYAGRLGSGRVMLQHGEDAVTWGEFERRATRRAWSLEAAGVTEGDFVTVSLPNGALFYECVFALWKLGAAPHVVSPKLPEAELDAVLSVARPRLILTAGRWGDLGWPVMNPEDALANACDDARPSRIAPHWKAMSSGGSTGRPKVIVDHMPGAIDIDAEPLRIRMESRLLNPGPLYHNGPFVVTHRGLFRGGTVIGMEKFDAQEALRLIELHRVSWVNLVPTMMQRIWRLAPSIRDSYDLRSLETVWHMAAPMPVWLKRAWIEWLGPERIWEMYGGTESNGHTSISGSEWLERPGSVGRALRCDIRILDPDGAPLPAGEVGEVFFRPHQGEGRGYHYLGAEVRSAGDGFESLGDFGWLDADGYLFLADRRTDLILRGGANIYPAEVEAALMEHAGVDGAVVIGLPDEDLGARVHAIVRPTGEGRVSEGDLRSFVRERLAAYKTPATYEFTNEQLRDDAGKVRRSALRAERLRTTPDAWPPSPGAG